MDTKKLAGRIHEILSDEKADLHNVDSSDSCIRQVEVGKDEFTFSLYENINEPTSGGRGRAQPRGHFEFAVTVTRKWVPMDEDDTRPPPAT